DQTRTRRHSRHGHLLQSEGLMARQYRYISGDSHLEIDSKYWIDRVPAMYRDQAPRLVRQPDGSDAWTIGDKIVRPAAAADLYGGKGPGPYLPAQDTRALREPEVPSSGSVSKIAMGSTPKSCFLHSKEDPSFGAVFKTTSHTKRWCVPTTAGLPRSTARSIRTG